MTIRRESARSPLAPSTKERYATALVHLVLHFRDRWVDGLDVAAVEEWQEYAARQVSPSTVNSWHRVLKVVLDEAVKQGVIDANPARMVSALPKGRTKGRRGTSLSVMEVQRLISEVAELSGKEIPADIGRMVLTLCWTGLRMGELLALRFEDHVDGELRISRSVWRGQERGTKTDDPRRVSVPSPLREVLEAQRRWLIETQHPGLASGLVFPSTPRNARAGSTRRGEELVWFRSSAVLRKPLERLARAARVPAFSPHSLRRTYENLLRAAGVEPLVRRASAGWRSARTQEIYATVTRDERDNAAESLKRLVLGD